MSQLEGSLQQPKAQSSMSPYLVPDTAALCQHLNLIRQLASSSCFIIIIPRTGRYPASLLVCARPRVALKCNIVCSGLLFVIVVVVFFYVVIDGLDRLKKENAGARDGIRFLETEFRKGNRCVLILCA